MTKRSQAGRVTRLYDQVARLMVRDLEGALQKVESTNLRPEPRLMALKGYVLEAMGDTRSARRILQRARRRWPKDPFASLALGEFYADYGTRRQAVPLLERAIDLTVRKAPGTQVSAIGEEATHLLLRLYPGASGWKHRVRIVARGLSIWPESKALLKEMARQIEDGRLSRRRVRRRSRKSRT